MSETVKVTLEIELVPNDMYNLDMPCETMLFGAVSAISSGHATGTGFHYSYAKKKSKRGLTITKPKESNNE